MIYMPHVPAHVDLYILRHGEAGKRVAAGSKDSERALTVVGAKEVEEIAGALAKLGIKPDLVATSPLARSRQTAVIVAKRLKVKNKLQDWDELKPEGSKVKLYERLARFKPDASVMVVGHEPYLSSIIGELAFDGQKGRVVMKKAGLARVDVVSFRPRPRGELKWLLTPRIMKRMEP